MAAAVVLLEEAEWGTIKGVLVMIEVEEVVEADPALGLVVPAIGYVRHATITTLPIVTSVIDAGPKSQ